jgi:hypothetical protein
MVGPEFLFKYDWIPIFQNLPEPILKSLLGLLLLSTIFIAIGRLYRIAIIYFFLGFTYFSFIDKSLYNNHLYLISLISFVMIFMDADKKYRLGVSSESSAKIPSWNIRILQFLILLVYTYGAFSKINIDWFDGSLVENMISGAKSDTFKQHLPQTLLVPFLVYGGFLFDLLIGFFLIYGPTRLIAFMLVVIFNTINGIFLFDDIGVFPCFMVASCVLFLKPDLSSLKKYLPQKPLKKAQKKQLQKKLQITDNVKSPGAWTLKKTITVVLLSVFVLFNLLWPFRYLLFTKNPEWTGHGARFSWRMKMQTKKIETFNLIMTDGPTSNPTEINYKSFLTVNQQKHIVDEPRMVIQFAKYLRQKAISKGMAKDPVIKSNIIVSMNNRPYQLLIDPNVDLTKVDESVWADQSWILPLQKKYKN